MDLKNLRIVESQINIVEKHHSKIKTKVKKYCDEKKVEKRTIEKLGSLLVQYSYAEFSPSLKNTLEDFSKILQKFSQIISFYLKCLDEEVVKTIKTESKHLKADLKRAMTAAETERIRSKQLTRLEMLKDKQHERISAAEAQLLQAKADNMKARKAVQEHSEIFEQKKLKGLQRSLLAWTSCELRYHAKALELFTEAYRVVAALDIKSDLAEFRSKMRTDEQSSNLFTVENALRQRFTSLFIDSAQWNPARNRSRASVHDDTPNSQSGGTPKNIQGV